MRLAFERQSKKPRGRGSIPAGQRYETVADMVGRPVH